MPVVITMCVIKSQYSAIVTMTDGRVNVGKVVARDDGTTIFNMAPNLVAQYPAAGFLFELKSFLFEKYFFGNFCHSG